MIVAMWKGLGGNREVPPLRILGGAEAYSNEEGARGGNLVSPDWSEPKANDVTTINALVTAALVVAF
jgi:hypothetical protein